MGSKASRDVASSIYLLRGVFTSRIFHAIFVTLSIDSNDLFQRVLQGHRERTNGFVFAVKQDHRNAESNYEGEEGGSPADGGGEGDHCFFARLAMRFSESGCSTQGTSTDMNRTHPVSV